MIDTLKTSFKWSEPLIIAGIYLLILLWNFIDAGEYLFSYPFNVMDGTIYYALFIGGLGNAIVFGSLVYLIIPKFLSQRQYIKFLGSIVIVYVGATGLEYLVEEWLKMRFDLPGSIREMYTLSYETPIRDIGGPAWAINLAVLIFAFIYRFTKDWMFHEKHKRELMEEKLGTELKLLKSQIHPHFLFNTLNNIYSITLKNKDSEATEAIGKLSGILRFMLYENDEELIPITKEITYIKDLTAIQFLRVDEGELEVDFQIEGETSGVTIAPMILIPFVENAFKYGIDHKSKSVILIHLAIEEKRLKFVIQNTIYKRGEESMGMGISNVSRRLNLIYGKKHSLDIDETGDAFKVVLEIRYE